jgi:hypothetical protein
VNPVVLVLHPEQTVVDGAVLVVVGTCSESEGVRRRPSQDAFSVTKPARRGFLFMLLLQVG